MIICLAHYECFIPLLVAVSLRALVLTRTRAVAVPPCPKDYSEIHNNFPSHPVV